VIHRVRISDAFRARNRQLTSKTHILIAEDETNLRRVLRAQLQRDGYEVRAVGDGEAALEVLRQHPIDVVITDLRMPKVDGMQVVRHVKQEYDHIPVIVITAHGTVDTAVEALKLGAFDYVTKPFDRVELGRVVAKAARLSEISSKHASVGSDLPGRYRIIGQSEAMARVYGVIDRVAATPSTVLITGESGTGKELIARALHENSDVRDSSLIRVNCGAIPPDLIESELFGYEKGAFTGAVTSKPGRFELADGGTLFLDEIMQVKLLRAIQEQEFERVGGIKTIKVSVRLIAATNQDLGVAIDEGRFREDLYYRLNVVHLHLPPLRERADDIPLLVEHFIGRFNQRLGREVVGLSEDAQRRLIELPWRGNIRELENVVERCMLFCDGDQIELHHIPENLAEAETRAAAPSLISVEESTASRSLEAPGEAPEATDLKEAVREAATKVERELIVRALEQTGGNVTHTAKLLNISRKSLQNKMKDLGLREA